MLTPGQQLAAALFCTVMGIGSTVGWFAVAGGVAFFGVTRHSTADAVRQALFLWLLIAYCTLPASGCCDTAPRHAYAR